MLISFSTNLWSQTYTSSVVGKYLCKRVMYDGSNNPINTCTCHLLLYASTVHSVCVDYGDSCFTQNWSGTTLNIEVKSDSSFIGYAPWSNPLVANGKLYFNDSIHLSVHFPNPPTYDFRKIFDGHKLYNNLSVAEMYLPENALIVSPNPASETIYIESVQQNFGNAPPIIYNGSGNKVNVEVNFINSKTYKANVSHLSSGIYFVFIQSSKGYIRQKVIIEH